MSVLICSLLTVSSPRVCNIRRKQHAGAYPRAVIIFLRQRHPAAVFIDSHRIRTQVAGSGKIGINLHHAPASFTLGTDSFEIHARHVRVPDPSAECARGKGRDEFHLSGRGVSAEDRELFRRPADHGRETFGPCRTLIAVSRKKAVQAQPSELPLGPSGAASAGARTGWYRSAASASGPAASKSL